MRARRSRGGILSLVLWSFSSPGVPGTLLGMGLALQQEVGSIKHTASDLTFPEIEAVAKQEPNFKSQRQGKNPFPLSSTCSSMDNEPTGELPVGLSCGEGGFSPAPR